MPVANKRQQIVMKRVDSKFGRLLTPLLGVWVFFHMFTVYHNKPKGVIPIPIYDIVIESLCIRKVPACGCMYGW